MAVESLKARLTIGGTGLTRKKVRGPGASRGPSTARAVPGLRPNRIRSVHGLAVQREIETFALHLVGDAQPDEDVDDLEDDQRDDGVVDEDDDDTVDLVEELYRIAFEQAGGAAIGLDREHAGEQGTGDAADRVHAERVERVVIAQHVLQAGAAPVAEHAGSDADHHRADRADEA